VKFLEPLIFYLAEDAKESLSKRRSFLSENESDSPDDASRPPPDDSSTPDWRCEIERVDPIEFDTIPFEMPHKISISLPPPKSIDLFMFHVHEEGRPSICSAST
jgi:hypothetical protein